MPAVRLPGAKCSHEQPARAKSCATRGGVAEEPRLPNAVAIPLQVKNERSGTDCVADVAAFDIVSSSAWHLS